MFDHLKIHTAKLFATWAVGTTTWVADYINHATSVLGFLGALVGVLAGTMLVVIRWDDFVDSNPIRKLRGLPPKKRAKSVTE